MEEPWTNHEGTMKEVPLNPVSFVWVLFRCIASVLPKRGKYRSDNSFLFGGEAIYC